MSVIRSERVFSQLPTSISSRHLASIGGFLAAAAMAAALLMILLSFSGPVPHKGVGFVTMSIVIGFGFHLFIAGASRFCSRCGKTYVPGETVIEVLGRGAGQFFSHHKECPESQIVPQ